MVSSIAHPTDLSPQGIPAFEHALSLALANRCRLDLLHVDDPGATPDWDDFPHVRQTLERWGILPPGAPVEAIEQSTGVTVRKVGIRDRGPVEGLAHYLGEKHADLIVMATHGRAGIDRLVNSSVTADLVHTLGVPTLILGPAARSFVDPANGRLAIRKVLVPVDHDPDPHAETFRCRSTWFTSVAPHRCCAIGAKCARLPARWSRRCLPRPRRPTWWRCRWSARRVSSTRSRGAPPNA
jgi:nucleotide-binding universal stress UspA family protein